MPEEADIESNFDVSDWIADPAPSSANCVPWPPEESDPTYPPYQAPGKLRFNCYSSHLSYDDPILYPGQPGMAHLHNYYGNTLADAYSTYQSLRETGDGTCSGGPLNRTAYWHPAMIRPQSNQVVRPNSITVYYTIGNNHGPYTSGNPNFLPTLVAPKSYPRGIKFIGGWPDETTYAIGSISSGVQDPDVALGVWYFVDDVGHTPEATQNGHFNTIAEAAASANANGHGQASTALVGNSLENRFTMPNCWDGVNYSSSNGRSHFTYQRNDADGHNLCPPSHPITLPEILIIVRWSHSGHADAAQWYLSSDQGHGAPAAEYEGGHTWHIDWFGAWDQEVVDTWSFFVAGIGVGSFATECSNGNLGNDTSMIESHMPASANSGYLAVGERYWEIPEEPGTPQPFFGFPLLSMRV